MDHDQAFFALSQQLQRRIDTAFLSTVKHAQSLNALADRHDVRPSSAEPPLKRRKTLSEFPADSGGGFVVMDNLNAAADADMGGGGFVLKDSLDVAGGGGGGGFIIDDDMSIAIGGGFVDEETLGDENPDSPIQESAPESPEASQISLSSIPTALQLLDLLPDDEQVLAIFRNAATGWDNHDGSSTDDNLAVTRADWRAVCTILLEPGGSIGNDSTDGGSQRSLEGDDEYVQDFVEEDVDMQFNDGTDSDDNYEPGPSSAAKSKSRSIRRPTRVKASVSGGKRRARGSRIQDDSESDADEELVDGHEEGSSSRTRTLTSRQKATCIEAFRLLFPDAKDDLLKRRIMLADIQRVGKLLGEKLKVEEMLEMLDVFSTAPDKSMGLQDFERMMIAAKLA
ncbi:hypothetical protein J3R30DRAFT_3696802 [Lentinula aciculospora]|uniref:Uncharacterized protein n=1 Tax=Lentinula aciculospora TaxID=153920 RepID=A0A9W9DU28_9AGAR|nr:hypothetical protein J3R30DRAFT_3696802 [Lentinula aciculospora]